MHKPWEIHHSKHHQGYVNKLNKALKDTPVSGNTIEDILKNEALPIQVRNNGGGHFNHSLYWDILTPGGAMSDTLKAAIVKKL
ncbi:superoxide dismutase [Aquimarina hainanensis]|uniref:superoxide dismutase n=1 Tax=Aquimarina hainanensis TaxID=1578017 RepID=UPI003618E12B